MTDVRTIAMVDDDIDALDALCTTIRRAGFKIRRCHDGEGVLDVVHDDWPGIVLTDMRMPRYSGVDLLRDIRKEAPSVPVVVISGHGDVSAATDVMKLGAEDFIEKPMEPDLLIEVLRRAIDKRSMHLRNRALMSLRPGLPELARLLPGKSLAMKQVRNEMQIIAGSGFNTLICGEPGTGKLTAARALVSLAEVDFADILEMDCAAISEAQLGARLSEAISPDSGARALLVREVSALPESLQLRLANAPETVLVVATSGQGLAALEDGEGALVPNLLYFINKAHLSLPPLRSRPTDVLPI